MTKQEIKLEIFKAVYQASCEWNTKEEKFAEEVLVWIQKK